MSSFQYQATLVKVVDGDTLDVSLDLGFHIRQETRIRLNGLDAPETSTTEGKAVKAFVAGWLADATLADPRLIVVTFKDKAEKYGRYLGEVHSMDGRCLNDDLIRLGKAKPYTGGTR